MPSRAAMMAPATSPSVMSLIRAPAARTSAISSACRGRSRMMTVTSCGEQCFARATAATLSAGGASTSTTPGRFLPGDQLGHVEDGRRVVHGAAGADGDHRDRVRHPVGGQPGAVDGVDRHVTGRAAAVADLFAVVQHRGIVFLALADDHDALHRHRVDEQPHGVHRGGIGSVLVAAADPPGGAIAPASVTRASSSARFRSGACRRAAARPGTSGWPSLEWQDAGSRSWRMRSPLAVMESYVPGGRASPGGGEP